MKFPLSFILIFFSLVCHGQKDTLSAQSKRWLHLHFANGVNFIRNENLQNAYGTKGVYFWGLGIRFGNPNHQKVFLHLDYNFSSYRVKSILNSIEENNLLRLNQLIPAISLQLIKWKSASIHTKTGYIFANLKDEINDIAKITSGFKIGIGIENKIFKNQSIHFDIDYDLMKSQGKFYNDYDVWKLSIGGYF